MVSGMNIYIQQPIANYFHTTLKAPDRAELINQILCELHKKGVKISNVTFDGYSSNAKMSNILGANFRDKNGDYKTHFAHPVDGSQVYIMYDPSHMEKLVRNTLGTVRTFYDGTKKIEWEFFEKLEQLGRHNSFGLATKMSKRHLEFKDRKMHVRTAVETLSATNADAMDFLNKNGNTEFRGVATTVKFTRIFDKLWDVMNSHRIRLDTQNIFKSALNPSNRDEIFKFLEETKKYILSLTIVAKTGKKIKIVHSDYRTGFRGFVINIISLTSMYKELVEKHHWLLFFATYRISQDHIEILFGKIRTMNGSNDNPMAYQFISAYRKILHQCEKTHSPYSNVHAIATCDAAALVSSNILTIPSTRNRRCTLEEDVNQFINRPDGQIIQAELGESEQEFEETYEFELIVRNSQSGLLSDSTNNSGIAHIANSIEQKLLNCSQIYCNVCLKVLEKNQKVDDKLCINPTQGKPCLSTYQICKETDVALKTLINTGPSFKYKIYNYVITSLNWDKIYPAFQHHEHDFEHKQFLIKFVIDDYINRKCTYIAKQKTMNSQKRYLRNKLRKLCHFYNQ